MASKSILAKYKLQIILASSCSIVLLILILYFLLRGPKKADGEKMEQIKSKLRTSKKELKENTAVLKELNSNVSQALTAEIKIQEDLTSKIMEATKELKSKESILSRQESRFLTTQAKLRNELSEHTNKALNLMSQLSKINGDIEESKQKSQALNSMLDIPDGIPYLGFQIQDAIVNDVDEDPIEEDIENSEDIGTTYYKSISSKLPSLITALHHTENTAMHQDDPVEKTMEHDEPEGLKMDQDKPEVETMDQNEPRETMDMGQDEIERENSSENSMKDGENSSGNEDEMS